MNSVFSDPAFRSRRPIDFALEVFYFIFISRGYAGKVGVQGDTQGFY
jgi:hypothetical protein